MSMYNKDISKEHSLYLDRFKKRKRKIMITQVSLFLFTLVVWELLARFKLIDTFLTSYPSEIWALLLLYIKQGNLFHHVGISVFEVIVGFLAGTFLGLIVAIGLWWSDFWARVLDPYLVMLNSLPKTALAPIIIIWVGAGYSGIIVTAISISIIVTIMNMFDSFKNVDEDQIKLLNTFGASKLQVLEKLVLPSSLPTLVSTLKINIGLSWVGVIVGEFLVSKAGIGYLIVYGGQVFRFDIIMMSMLILTIISVLMYKIVTLVENKITHW